MQMRAILFCESKVFLNFFFKFYFKDNNLNFTDFLLLTGHKLDTNTANMK